MPVKKLLKSILVPPVVVFLALMVIVSSSYITTTQSLEDDRAEAVKAFVDQKRGQIQDRLDVYKEYLRSGVGLFNATDFVTKAMWSRFVESTTVLQRYPGAQGIGYAYTFNDDAYSSTIAQIRSDVHPSFTLYPNGRRDTYAAVIYYEPDNTRNRQLIGFDMFSEESRREAMVSAQDSGEITITESLELILEEEPDKKVGFILYAPQYADNTKPVSKEERQENIRGYIYAVFRAQTFLEQLFLGEDNPHFQFRLIDSANGTTLLYKTDEFTSVAQRFGVRYIDNLSLNGTTWNMELAYDEDEVLPATLSNRPRNIFLGGTLGAVLIALTTLLLLKNKSNQLLYEQERSVSQAKDSLLSIASHQLRTPATGVKQYIGLLLQGFVGELSGKQETILEKAYASNERQLKTINDVLYLARLDAGRIVIVRKPTDISDMIRSVVDEMLPEFTAREHTYSLHMPKRTVRADVDEHMIRMIVENLISNAIKYTKSQGTIDMTVKNLKEEITFSVADTGVGIKELDIKERLFKQFSRVPNELSQKVTGTGVGLYLSKHLAQLHGGSIEVESEFGKGSTFTLHIPKV